ncbi:glycosyltransferase [Algicella marina]|uniref:Glycosyltransferase n=1 Tax=Algicella marina TaxID=2683284 RepID=A0A6P1T137_9RHOB|nr:glycosyltransferase [Algicella marina]QHQ36624.1 glycosyltransferase [Algicella marina]
MRICFVALEILGPFNGGGIATALAGQAEHHAKSHDVTVLYVHPGLKQKDAAQWETFYAARDIRFIRAEFDTFYPLDSIPKRSFAVKQYLEEMDEAFDVIFFHDYLGLGYYTALSRALGLGFKETKIGSVIHGPSEWARSLNMVTDKPRDLLLYEVERKQLEYSDFAVAPSPHIIDWCREQGWTLPDDTRAVSNVLPHRLDVHTGLKQGDVQAVDEVCFFGRLETRKGIFTFLDAIRYLHKNDLALPKKITFLGSFCVNGFRNAASTVLEYAENWDCEFQFLNNYSHEMAINYLVEKKPLTILPSRDESFGLTAYECLHFGVPALIADRGALKTLAAEPERQAILFEPTANTLARKIAGAIEDGMVIGAVDPIHLAAEQDWDRLLDDLDTKSHKPDPTRAVVSLDPISKPKPRSKTAKDPLVSVILVHHNRVSTLRGALASLISQTYENLEIIIADDGSSVAEFAALNRLVAETGDDRIRVFQQENRYLGAARNFGVSHASGEYFLFMDDDNIAMPTEIETFVSVALATDADILNSVSQMFRTNAGVREAFDLFLPVGPSLELAVLGNTFGDANALVKREAFEDIGGYTEQYAVGCEDYELFTRAFLSGKKMQLIPDYLFEYRSEDDGMMKELNSGKYIINQTRGVTALFDTHRDIDLAQMRRLMRVGFFSAVSEEYDYWRREGSKKRRHPQLEEKLASARGGPNGSEACETVAQLMAAEGMISQAVDLIERNRISPTDSMLARLQQLHNQHKSREENSGQQRNIIVNPSFEFWTTGNRFEGISPYQYTANEWLIPTPKNRPGLIVSQRNDNALLSQTHARTGTYMRLQLNEADPEGYLFLSQRNFELGSVLEREVEVSVLTRASYEGDLIVFLRVTTDPETGDLQDVHPTQTARVSTDWRRATFSFNLSEFQVDAMKTNSFLSVFIAVPTHHVLYLDVTDVTMVPKGNNVTIAPYIRSTELRRAEHRCFTVGRDARIEPKDNRQALVHLTPAQAEKIAWDSRYFVVSPCVTLQANGLVFESNIQSVNFDDAAEGSASLLITLDKQLEEGGVLIDDIVAVSNYLEG